MIPIFKPSYDEREIDILRKVFDSRWIGLGPMTEKFEKEFAGYIGSKHAVGLNSATAALHLALMVAGVEGKEVITTPMTFVSTNHAILYNGGIPVFCDIEADTLNIDASKIEALVTEKTAAIMAVHYGGYSCDMDPILDIADKYYLKVIEDVAHGCGGEYKGRKQGSIGFAGTFSFHAVKNLATGDGGMITIDDPDLDAKLRRLRWLGITKDTWLREKNDERKYSWYYDIAEVGFKCHMNDINAAIGLVQLEKLDKANELRGNLTAKYNEAFKDVEWIETTPVRPYTKPAFHNYVIKVEGRDELCEYLKVKGIASGVHYIPNNHYSMYKTCRGETPVAESVWKKILTIPLFPDMTEKEQDYIIETIIGWKK